MAKKMKATKKIDKVQNKRIAKLEKELQASVNFAEVFFIKSITDVTTTGSPLQPPIAQGLDLQDRLGSEIKPLSLDVGLRYEMDGAVANFDSIRTIIIRVPEVSGVTPTLAQVLHDVTSAPQGLLTGHSWVNKHNFVYVKDFVTTLQSNYANQKVTVVKKIRLSKRELKLQKFKSTSGAVSDFINNQFFILFLSLQNGATGVAVNVDMTWNP